jgi:flagellar motor switch protein FliN/FliY
MTSGDGDQVFPEPSLTEFASELTAAADDAAEALSTFAPREQIAGPRGSGTSGAIDIQTIMRIPVTMKVVVGSATLAVSELKNLKSGETISLNRRVGEPVDVVVNGQVLARGVLVIVDKDTSQLGLSLTEVVGTGGSFTGSTPSKR